MQLAVQKGAAGQDEGLAVKAVAKTRAQTADPAVLQQYLAGLGLVHKEVFLQFEAQLHAILIDGAVALRARRLGGGALGGVEHPELYAAGVGVQRHFAAQSVDLAYQLSLGNAAYGGIAGHLRYVVVVEREQQGSGA